MDGHSRPYFCGIDQTLNFQQKEALAQGILQVVETIPDDFDTFEFQFIEHQVHLYKLDRGMVLLVLTGSNLVYADCLGTIKQLKAILQENIPNAIATFRLIADNIPLTSLNNRRHTTESATLIDDPITVKAQDTHAAAPALETVTPPTLLDPLPEQTLASPSEPITLKEAIAALNQLSQFTTQYLGTHVITNYWKATRPQVDWLAPVQIDRSAQFSLTGESSQNALTPLTAQEQQWLQAWVGAFVKRCTQVIRDFPAIIEQKALNEKQKALLLPPNL